MIKNRYWLFILIMALHFPASAQTILQPEDMKKDLAILKATWENVHAGLYRYSSPEQITSYLNHCEKRCASPLPLRDFYLMIAQLNAKLHCSHSYLSYYNNKKAIKEEVFSPVHLPLLFRVIEGKFILTHNLDFNLMLEPGQEIVAINTIPTARILDSLMTVTKADGRNGLKKMWNNCSIHPSDISSKHYNLFDIYFPLFFKSNLKEENFWVTVKQGRKLVSIKLKGLSKADREKAYTERFGPLPEQEQTWSTKEIDPSTVLFRLGDFSTYNWKFDFRRYLDSVFISFNQKGYKNLIIDIRENEGGSDETRDALLSYLTPKNIACANPVRRLYRYLHIPDSLKANLITWDESFLQDKSGFKAVEKGYYEKDQSTITCDSIYSNRNHFKGKQFLICDVSNSSATFIMADCFKRNQLGSLVGEQTGGSQSGINGGQILFFYLPNSKIEMDVPLIWQKPISDRPDEGILPDYLVPTTAKDIANAQDPQLNFIVKKLLKNQ